MTVVGTLVAESLRDDAVLRDLRLEVRAIIRTRAGDPTVGQPLLWTMIELEAPDDAFDDLVAQLSDAIRSGPWYCDLRTELEIAVVFAGRAFRYRRGDGAGRAEAERHARASGVPDGQTDWPD